MENHKDMQPLHAFLASTNTEDGNAIIVGGLCTQAVESVDPLLNQLQQLQMNHCGLMELDYRLSHCIQANAWPELVAVGACTTSVCNTAVGGSGGVIGSPHQKACSATDQWEDLGHQLWLHASPGGPGLIVQGDQTLVTYIQNRFFDTEMSPDQRGQRLLLWLTEQSPIAYLITLDGYGQSTPGFVAVSDGTKATCMQLGSVPCLADVI